MAKSKWAMMADFSIELPDEPGALARLAGMLREADVNLVGLWGYGPRARGGTARFYCVPQSADQFRNFARSAELGFHEGRTFYLRGADKGGALVETLDKIASAGINLRAIEAVVVDGDFGCFIWAEQGSWSTLERLLT